MKSARACLAYTLGTMPQCFARLFMLEMLSSKVNIHLDASDKVIDPLQLAVAAALVNEQMDSAYPLCSSTFTTSIVKKPLQIKQ